MNTGPAGALEQALSYWPQIYGLALQLLGDHARAEDVSQETVMRIGMGRREIDLSRPLRELLLTTVRRLALSELRRRRLSSLDEVRDEGGEMCDPKSPDPVQESQVQEQRAAVRAALDRLRPSWRAMLYLRDGLGFSYQQIAAILEKSEDVVRVTLHRARSRVRDMLELSVLEGDRS